MIGSTMDSEGWYIPSDPLREQIMSPFSLYMKNSNTFVFVFIGRDACTESIY